MAELIPARDLSPDSVILTSESHFSSLFSSASASVDRCSFTSDHDSPSSDVFQHLGRGSDLDRPHTIKNHGSVNSGYVCKRVETSKVYREEDNNKKVLVYHDHGNEIQTPDSGRSSFSLALKECQERRSRCETLLRKLDRQRPASLDLNNSGTNMLSVSPRLGVMKKTSISSRKSGNFPSPGTPNYRHGSVVGVNKAWSLERVSLPNNANRRQVEAAEAFPLNNGSRALPSKWEDAERWIFSPLGGERSGRPSPYSQQTMLRRPKSKSGPLGLPGAAYCSLYSPAVRMYESSSNLSCHKAGSPYSAGVMMGDGLSFDKGSGANRFFSNSLEPCIARSTSVHGGICQASSISSQDEKLDDLKDNATNVSRVISRRDMATQMSPEDSCPSSPRRSSFSPSSPSILPIVEVQSCTSSKSEARDAQIDERVTVTRWSKKYRVHSKDSKNVDDWKLKAIEPRSSLWEVSAIKSLSKERQEAKISAWENLQKAKAEAAMRKLEMKLEKRRASSMDKIMKKLRYAQKKAHDMRSSVLTNQAVQLSKMNDDTISLHRTRHIGSLTGCFTCHAF